MAKYEVENHEDTDLLIRELIESREKGNLKSIAILKRISKIKIGGEKFIVDLIRTIEHRKELFLFVQDQTVSCLKEIVGYNPDHLIIQELREILTRRSLFWPKQGWEVGYEIFYEITLHCTQNMSYLDFYQAWHDPISSSDVELSTNDEGAKL